MNNKRDDFPEKLRSIDDYRHRKNGRPQSVYSSVDVTEIVSPFDSFLVLQESKNKNTNSEDEIVELNTKLNEVVRTYSKFISIIAHDLRSPFTAILSSLELVKMKLEKYNFDDLGNYVDMASDSAVRTLHLLDDLLEWTISKDVHKNLNPVKINLFELVEEQIADIITLLNYKQLSIKHFIDPELHVFADKRMVKTILRNLIGNAIKYTHSGGEITISSSDCKKFVKVIVSDTGVGISQEAQKKLYIIDKLQNTSGTNNERGSGFGLILCKDLVEIHGGTLSLESEPGKGSKFMFTLPHSV
ncbi:MAG TPA: HAMP domain-containing sensor histidine kinase [Bacteroidales bacterium]|nr:HAMP domain-containing sensor histidine kinase [Bacteroidales bacterium]